MTPEQARTVYVLRSHCQFSYSKIALIMRFITETDWEPHKMGGVWVGSAEGALDMPLNFMDEVTLMEILCMDCKHIELATAPAICSECGSKNIVAAGANSCATNKAIIEAKELIGYLRASLPPVGAGNQGDDWPLELKAESMEEATRAATMISNLENALKDVSWPNFNPPTP